MSTAQLGSLRLVPIHFNHNGFSLNFVVCVALAVVAVVGSAFGAPVTNADIAKLVAAGMSDDVILNVIGSGEPQFDTSPDALIGLKQKGASAAVLAAMTRQRGQSKPVSSPSAPAEAAPLQCLPSIGMTWFSSPAKAERS